MNVYMIRGDAFITTRAHGYSKPSTSEKGKEDELPSLPLQIEKMLGETRVGLACRFLTIKKLLFNLPPKT
jgi:hypothetical protein